MDCGPTQRHEVAVAVNKLKLKTACGVDGILPEHLKVLASTPAGFDLLVELCDTRRCFQTTPESWKKLESGFGI